MTLTNVEFRENNAVDGSGMSNTRSNPILINVTMSGNKAGEYGGKVAIDNEFGASTPIIRNRIIVGNNGPAIKGNATIENSLIGDHEKGKLYDGKGNPGDEDYKIADIFINPNPTSPDKADYRLKAGSPAIDKGDATYKELEQMDEDLDGNDRIWGAGIDLGAYEYSPVSALRNLQATAGDGEVSLTWKVAPDHVSYNVYQYEGKTAPNDEQQWLACEW